MTDLERAIKALKDKGPLAKLYWQYYDGDHPQVYVAERLHEVFENLDVNFHLNWCALVIDAVNDRIRLSGFTSEDDRIRDTMEDLYARLDILLDSEDVHESALVTGEGFLLAWKDEGQSTEIYYHDPRLCHLFYNEDRPKVKEFGAKWYVGEQDKLLHISLYYPDRIQRWESRRELKATGNIPEKESAYDLVDEALHYYDEVPMFRFAPSRRITKSDLKSVIAPQDAVNKMLMDMLVAAEFAAFRQRWVISNADLSDLRNRPGSILDIPAGDGLSQPTQVGEFGETNLQNYLSTLDGLAQAISAITRTPKHFFFRDTQAPSGEALMALEGPLIGKADNYINYFKPTWREFMKFLLKLELGEDVDDLLIVPIFEDPKSIQPLTLAQTRQTNTTAGIPIITQLRDEGKSKAWIDQMQKDQKEEKKSTSSLMTDAITRAQTNLQRGREPIEEEDEEEVKE